MNKLVFDLQRFVYASNNNRYSLISGTSYNDTFYNHANGATLAGYDGNDYLISFNDGSWVTLLGGYDKDTIKSWSKYSRIDGGSGDDHLYAGEDYATVIGGYGNDSVINYGYYGLISGGDGSDTIDITSIGEYSTINGGTGNDRISLSGGSDYNYIQFAAGDGYDTIYGYTSTNRISLPSYAYYTRSTVGNNVIISLTGGGSMNLIGASGKTVSVVGGILSSGSSGGSGGSSSGGRYFTNRSNYSLVSGTSYNDTFYNYASGATLAGYDGNDYLVSFNDGSWVTILGGYDKDTIKSWSKYSRIDGGSGDDHLYAGEDYATVIGGYGNDSIINYGYYGLISGGDGSDTIDITSIGEYSTINGGTGNDRISLSGGSDYNYIQFAAGDGYDTIYGYTSTNRISLPSYAYYTRSTVGNNVIISLTGGGSMNLIDANGRNVSVVGGILSSGSTTSGGGGSGSVGSGSARNVSNANSYVTINASNYNDTISNSGKNVKIYALGGNDTIYNNATNVTISAGAGRDTIHIGYADSTSIDAGSDSDSIWGNNNRTTITANNGDDTITGNHYGSKLFGGNGNDLISITTYAYNTIDGGNDNDTIIAAGNSHSVYGGDGNDKISLSGNNLTIKGGTGDDVIYGNTSTTHLYQYVRGDGKDIIYNWSSNDKLTLTGGGTYSTKISGNNILVNISDGGVITLGGAAGKTVNINGTNVKTTSTTSTTSGGGSTSKDVTPQDVIKKFMLSLDKSSGYNVTTMLNNATNYASNGKYKTIQAAIDAMVKDCKSYSGNWDRFLKDKCDIDLNNDDTGAISGKDAGGSTVKTKYSIVPENSSLNKSFTGNYFNVNSLNVYLAKTSGNGVQTINYNDSSLDAKKRYIWQALKDWWLPGALNLIKESYGENFSFSNKSSSTIDNNKLYVTFYNDSSDGALAGVSVINNAQGKLMNSSGDVVGSLKLGINMYYYSNIIIDDKDGMRNGNSQQSLDRVLSHEFTHAVMNANIQNATGTPSGLPQFIKDGFSELTHGIDDDRKHDIIAYASDYNALNKALDVNKLYQHYPAYAGGFMFLRYIAKQFSTTRSNTSSYSDNAVGGNELPKGITREGALIKVSTAFKGNKIYLSDYSDAITKIDAAALASNVEIIGNESDNSIKSGKGADKILGGAGKDSIWGGKGNDVLYGGSGDDKLYGEAGDDSIHGGLGNNTLSGGAGKDIFAYEGGKDFIEDYKSGEDKVKILTGSIKKSAISGNNVVLTTEDGSITIKNAKGQKLTIIDAEEKEKTTVYGGATNSTLLTVNNSTKSPLTVGSDVKLINASTRTTDIRITGNKLANTIKGGKGNDTLIGGDGNDTILGSYGNDRLYGQAGNDTLTGGPGNDNLWGGDGNDIFIYGNGDGKDVIRDYASGDKISIKGSISKAAAKDSDVVFTIGTGYIIVKNAMGKSISMINSSGKNYSTIVGGTKTLTVTDSTKSPVTVDLSIKTIDASTRTTAVKITGNSLDNTIKGSRGNDKIYGGDGNDTILGGYGNDKIAGQAGNDTLTGGKGNDSLWGNAGSDTFVYASGDGRDVIFGFENNDMLKISGTFTTNYNKSKKEVYFDVGSTSNAITLKDFSATSFNVNGTKYKLGSNKLVK